MRGNLITANESIGVEVYDAVNTIIENNTITGNGVVPPNNPTYNEQDGIRLYSGSNQGGHLVTRNIISNNYGAGVKVLGSMGNVISENSIFDNGEISGWVQ